MKKRRQYGRFYTQKWIKHTTKLKIITLSVREDSKAVDIVCVTVVNLHAFTRHQPPSNTGVITAGEKLHVVYHREPSHTVLMTCRKHTFQISHTPGVTRATIFTNGDPFWRAVTIKQAPIFLYSASNKHCCLVKSIRGISSTNVPV